MKKALVIVALLCALVIVGLFAYRVIPKDQRLDQLLSQSFSKKTGLSWVFEGAALESWSSLRFKKALVGSPTGRDWLSSGVGRLRANRPFFLWPSQILLSGHDLRPANGAIPAADNLHLVLDRFELVMFKRAAGTAVHLFDCQSPQVKLVGGLLFDRGRPYKAHALIRFKPDVLGRVGQNMAQGLRIHFRKGLIAVHSGKRPLFEAQWQ